MKRYLVIITLWACFFAFQGESFAQWISPGKLVESHKELEGIVNCFKCHKLTKKIADVSCMECHEKLSKLIKAKKGYHANVKGDCASCHTDHKGLDYDITGLIKDEFDHDKAGYSLKGKHKIQCDKCHKKAKTYLDLLPECLGCHTDVHQKTMSEDCIKCHSFKGWKDLVTDHDKSSEYKLTGKHSDVKCELCHPRYSVQGTGDDAGKVYQLLKFKPIKYGKCDDCHADIHKGKLKQKTCERCHVTKGWKETVFDHNDRRSADYKLTGKHKEVTCKLCHPEEKKTFRENGKDIERLTLKLKPIKHAVCNNCHYDVHKGQFKKQPCDACHSLEKSWRESSFKHESKKYRGYKLEGKHIDVKCEKCHARSEIRYVEFNRKKTISIAKLKPLDSANCSGCHYDVHKGQFKKQLCEECHLLNKDWRDTKFLHESKEYTGYKLEGKHIDVLCEKCHERTEVRYREFSIIKKALVSKFKPIKSETCGTCHKEDHKGKFKEIETVEGVTCDNCHFIDKEWKEFKYTHKPDSKYIKYNPAGQIKESNCEECHVCQSDVFSITGCFEKMGIMPGM